MQKKRQKKFKPVDKAQPSLMDYIVTEDTNVTVKYATEKRLAEESGVDAKADDKVDDNLLRTESIYIPYNERISELCRLSNNVYIDGNIKMRENFFEKFE